MKITIKRTHPGPQSCYFAFSHRVQGKWGSRFSALSKALIIFKFCMRLGPTETQLMSCPPACNNVLIPIYGVAEICGPKTLAPSVSQNTLLIMPKLASVCSTGGRLQMMKISKHSVRNRYSYEH